MQTATNTNRAKAAESDRQPSAFGATGAWFWRVAAACTFFPITAVLHHRVFVRPHCMTNLLSSGHTALAWIRSDPSPWLGLAAAMVTFVVVSRDERFRSWVAAIPISFFPLSLWLWDIPGTSILCPLLHDGKVGLRSWHFYLLGAALYLPTVAWLMRGRMIPRRVPALPSAVGRLRAGKRPVTVWFPGPAGSEEIPPERHLRRP